MKTPVEFLRWLRPGGPWSLSAIVPDGKMTTRIFTDPDEAARWIAERDGRENLYYAVNPLRPGYTDDKKAGKADVAGMEFLHVDVDHLGVDHLARLREHEPSVIIMSGGGYNALWRLKDPVPAPDDGDWSALEAYNKHLENLYAADACHNIDRILRLPFTVNLPNAKKRRAGRSEVRAEIVEIGGQTRPLSAFQRPGDGLRKQSDTSRVVSPLTLPEVIPEYDIDDAPLTDQWKVAVFNGVHPIRPEKYRGDRSRLVLAVVRKMVHCGMRDAEIASLLLNRDYGISAHVLTQPNPRRCVERAIARVRREANG